MSAGLPTWQDPTRHRDQVHGRPKVLLHDHLDGGLRPADDRRAGRRDRPRAARPTDAEALGRWFAEAADSGLAGALPGDLRPHRRGDADRRRR